MFTARLRALAALEEDPAEFQDRIEAAAKLVAADRALGWMDLHPLRGAYAPEHWSFKPFRSEPDFMVLCIPRSRELILSDLGPHARFFTRGRKTRPPQN